MKKLRVLVLLTCLASIPAWSQGVSEVREAIDDVDRRIVMLLAERGDYVRLLKAMKGNRPKKDLQRELEVLALAHRNAYEYDADPEVVQEVFQCMMDSFVKMQERKD